LRFDGSRFPDPENHPSDANSCEFAAVRRGFQAIPLAGSGIYHQFREQTFYRSLDEPKIQRLKEEKQVFYPISLHTL